MELVPIKTVYGEDKSWDEICELDSSDVSSRTLSTFDRDTGGYTLKCFGLDFEVYPCDRKIVCDEPGGDLFLGRLKDLFRLSVLWYFASAKDIPFSGCLVRPADLKGGQRFAKGTHVLPLEEIAKKYSRDPEGFILRGQDYGAERVEGPGDAAIRIYPLPRVPVTMLLWVEDDEFPPRVDLFLDSTCNFQIALSDIIWAVSTICALVMLEDD